MRENMDFILTLNEQDLDIVSMALVELPYKIAAPLILKINSQISEQNKKNEEENKINKSFPSKI